MDGGELSVPDNEYESFLRICAESICDGEKLFIVEQRSHPVYKLFFDFDIFMYNLIDKNEYYVNVCKLLVSTLNELFDDSVDNFELICSVTDVKQARKNQKECYKYGVHIISPTLIVNKENMLRVREAVVQKFQNNLDKDGPTLWVDDIDKVVYESNGFRMNYSRKGSKCKCSQKQRDLCDKCGGSGKVDEGRPYIPFLTMMNDYSYTTHENNIDFDTVYEMLKKTSIRVRPEVASSMVEFNESPPSWFEDSTLFDVPDGLITQGPPKKRKLTEGLDSVESKLENKKDLSVSELDTLNTWFQTMCNRKQLPKQYKGITMQNAFSFTNNNVRSNIIARVDSQYCMNIGREHTTNTVYLLVNTVTKKAVMKCYCRCDTTEGRRTLVKGKRQMCKDFSSHSIDTSELQLTIGCGVVSRQINPRILAMF
tara:strand:- start:550 stop:1824 length:1275 start_codon:yes stop_codon:yes gene_type:complete